MLRILPLHRIYICDTLLYVKTNLENYKTISDIHQQDKRKKNNLSIIPHSTSLYIANCIYTGLQVYNVLPDDH